MFTYYIICLHPVTSAIFVYTLSRSSIIFVYITSRSFAIFVYVLRHLFTSRNRLGQGQPPYLFTCDVTSGPEAIGTATMFAYITWLWHHFRVLKYHSLYLWRQIIIIIIIIKNEHWYDHIPKSAETSNECRVTKLLNQQARTDIIIPDYIPDIVIRGNKKETCMLTDVAIRGNRNVIKKEAEKILKHKDFITEIQHMWNVRAGAIPVIIRATGTISKSLRQYLSNIPGKHEIKELKKLQYWALHTQIKESANVKVQIVFNGRSNITCSTNCEYRRATTIHFIHLKHGWVQVFNCKYHAQRWQGLW